MDYCSIQAFHDALHNTQLFATIRPIKIEALCRTTHFAECRAVINRRKVMIYAPITIKAMSIAERAYSTLRGKPSELVGTFDILHNELNRKTSIIIENIPQGETLESAMLTMTQSKLLGGLSELNERMHLANISHNNLRKHNIFVDPDGHWHPVRLYTTTKGYGSDIEQLHTLRTEIESHAPDDRCLNEPISSYHTEYIPLREGRRRVVTAEGVGFTDAEGNIVIAPRYAWASDFDEGRAMVMTVEKRMGLIDTSGSEIIKAEYEIVEYSAKDGNSWVRQNNLWALFDYSGLQIIDWDERDMVDEDIEL